MEMLAIRDGELLITEFAYGSSYDLVRTSLGVETPYGLWFCPNMFAMNAAAVLNGAKVNSRLAHGVLITKELVQYISWYKDGRKPDPIPFVLSTELPFIMTASENSNSNDFLRVPLIMSDTLDQYIRWLEDCTSYTAALNMRRFKIADIQSKITKSYLPVSEWTAKMK